MTISSDVQSLFDTTNRNAQSQYRHSHYDIVLPVQLPYIDIQ